MDNKPNSLIDRIAKGQCVLFVGSGLSKHCHGLPVWSEFIQKVRNNITHDDDEHVTDENIEHYRLEYLEFAKSRYPNQYRHALQVILATPINSLPKTFDFLTKLKFAAIITTNLDSVVEDSFAKSNRPVIVVSKEEDITKLADRKGTPIIKMHGSLEDSEHVLTLSEYQNFDLQSRAMQSLVVSYISQFPILILGAGLSDPNFNKLNSIVNSSIKKFQHVAYYVSPKLPKFVQIVWEKRGLKFLNVEHNDIDDWIESLFYKVKQKEQMSKKFTSKNKVNVYTKARALMELGRALRSYSDLQSLYTSLVHMPDYGYFESAWEETLYSPLRRAISTALQYQIDQNTGSFGFYYAAPGPHSPILSELRKTHLRNRINRLYLADIDKSCFIKEGVNSKSNPKTFKTSCIVTDFSAGLGQELCNIYSSIFSDATSLSELEACLSKPEKLLEKAINSCGGKDSLLEHLISQAGTEVIEYPPGVAYSEMIASFAATAIFMSIRTKIFEKTQKSQDREIRERLIGFSVRLWQLFNELFFELHLKYLGSLVRKGGTVIVVTDTEKIFNDDNVPKALSFQQTVPTKIMGFDWLPLKKQSRLQWTDHELNYEAILYGQSVSDFKAHFHTVLIMEYEKV